MIKVLIAGTFDLLHPGHLNLFKQAKKLGDFLIAVVATDKNVLKLKNAPAYYGQEQRRQNLEKINLIDQALIGSENDPYQVIFKEKPDVILLGYDQRFFVDGLMEKIKSGGINWPLKIEHARPFKEDIFKSSKIRNVLADARAGFYLINKETDWTSHDVVAKLKNTIKADKVGHAGTLDPLATGLLICSLNKATVLSSMFNLLPKTYKARIKFGAVSDTFDRLGKIEESHQKIDFSSAELEKALDGFKGAQTQKAPLFSAKKIQGKKLYDLARKGKAVARPEQSVKIYDLKIISWSKPYLDLETSVSAGTYIRTLADDLGYKLGTGAVLWELERTAIGGFKLENSVKLEELALDPGKYLIKPLDALAKVNQEYLALD